MRHRLILILLAVLLASTISLSSQTPTQPSGGVQCTLLPADTSDAAHAFAAGDFARAESVYAALASPNGYIGLVSSQLAQDHLSDALASAHKAAAALPASGDAHALVGDALLRAGQIPEASTEYVAAMKLERCSSRAHFGWARLNDLLGRHATAAKELSIAHRLAPASPEIAAAWLETLPRNARVEPLRSFLALHPLLPPLETTRLQTELLQLDQHLTCTLSEASADNTRIPLQAILVNGRFTRSWGLKTNVNDKDFPPFELDTTSPGIVLTPRDAEKAGVRPLDSAKSPMPGESYPAVVSHIRIGSLDFHDCPVTVASSLANIEANSLIGTSFFRDHIVRIDYPARTFSLSPLPAPALTDAANGLTDATLDPAQKEWTQAYVSGPLILAPTLINKKGPYLFALDTGILQTVYAPAIAKAELSISLDQTLNLRGTSATIVKVLPRSGGGDTYVTDVHGPDGTLLPVFRPVKFPTLRFALSEIPDPTGVVFDLAPLSQQAHTQVAGLLGFTLLSYFYIDLNYRDAQVRLAFDQNRRYHVMQADERLF